MVVVNFPYASNIHSHLTSWKEVLNEEFVHFLPLGNFFGFAKTENCRSVEIVWLGVCGRSLIDLIQETWVRGASLVLVP